MMRTRRGSNLTTAIHNILIKTFCLDLDATYAASYLNLNRKTVNRYYRMFREIIAEHQDKEVTIQVGALELELARLRECVLNERIRDSYINDAAAGQNDQAEYIVEAFRKFAKLRLAKFFGVKKNFEHHMKETEWRWNKSIDVLEKELVQFLSSEPPAKST